MEKTKLKVGIFSITGCAGCQLSVIFNEDELLPLLSLIDLHAFPFIKKVNAEENFDYVLMEGLVATKEDLQKLKKIRKNTKNLIALGACAHTGCIPAYRNFTLKNRFNTVYNHTLENIRGNLKSISPSPIDAHVKVDYTIPGCPPDKNEILSTLYKIANGLTPRPYSEPVCVECRRNGNPCLLEFDKPCLGPITRGGCNSVCTNSGFECWGCRGHTDDANEKVLIEYFRKKGYSRKWIDERMKTFVGMKMGKF
ncbi:sulfhydrogenase 1 subunit delta [Candidatus Peregrinibacteria bacterium]|nr:sulfhydrogenase 1 subunit delta [Candidatus Peregrinibacteria bacterium]